VATISAHSPRTGTLQAYAHALTTGAEWVEFDLRRTGDGELVVFHDACTRRGETVAAISYARLCDESGYEVPKAADVMRLIAGKALGHLDLKDTGGEETVVGLAQAILGAGQFIVTTLEDPSVAAIKARFPDVPTALSLGRGLKAASWPRQATVRRSELFPVPRVRACGADWVAVNRQLARAGVVARCHRAGIKTMVWTVDDDREILRWLADPRVDVLITNRPQYAVRTRAGQETLAAI
jgi:glycerophosphoryl diester phosphodiesterase